jgi:hypothetical protein
MRGVRDRARGARIRGMATREQVHQLVDELPESRLDPVAEFIARGDEWGDLDGWSDAASRDTMRMLDEEEAAVGFSWEQRNSA